MTARALNHSEAVLVAGEPVGADEVSRDDIIRMARARKDDTCDELCVVITAQAAEIAALVSALETVMQWIKAWGPEFVFDDEWAADEDHIRALIAQHKGTEHG